MIHQLKVIVLISPPRDHLILSQGSTHRTVRHSFAVHLASTSHGHLIKDHILAADHFLSVSLLAELISLPLGITVPLFSGLISSKSIAKAFEQV